jgi:hypothetical protein
MISIVHLFRSTQNLTLHPLIHTLLNFNLVQNAVDGQVKAFQKITPIG